MSNSTDAGAIGTSPNFQDELFDKMWAAGAAIETAIRAGGRPKSSVEQALEALYRIICHFRPYPADGRKPVSSDVAAGVPEVSVRDIAAIVRLMFCGSPQPATVQACAVVLWLAEQEGIAQHDFRRFLREVGGVAVRAMAADIMAG